MTLLLSESEVEGLLDMNEVMGAVEEAFGASASGKASNSARTRSRSSDSVLNVMHANLQYLGRSGLKAYATSKAGTRFVVVLFGDSDSAPLAVMGADALGRYRTGAASGVATKHLFRERSATLALFGAGRQAMTQVLAMASAISLEEVRVWSPNPRHRESFALKVNQGGLKATACESPQAALRGAQVANTITSSIQPFLTAELLQGISHMNLCGGNVPTHAEVTADAVGSVHTVVVDDLPQAREEYGDLILAAESGHLSWDSVAELGEVVTGERSHGQRTLFKSGGVALEDVAVASAIYDKAAALAHHSSFDFV